VRERCVRTGEFGLIPPGGVSRARDTGGTGTPPRCTPAGELLSGTDTAPDAPIAQAMLVATIVTVVAHRRRRLVSSFNASFPPEPGPQYARAWPFMTREPRYPLFGGVALNNRNAEVAGAAGWENFR
jgi:hypothetical protein